jgi:hypothetical protein
MTIEKEVAQIARQPVESIASPMHQEVGGQHFNSTYHAMKAAAAKTPAETSLNVASAYSSGFVFHPASTAAPNSTTLQQDTARWAKNEWPGSDKVSLRLRAETQQLDMWQRGQGQAISPKAWADIRDHLASNLEAPWANQQKSGDKHSR